jgi:ABC-2 type transport system ATP-binding protein
MLRLPADRTLPERSSVSAERVGDEIAVEVHDLVKEYPTREGGRLAAVDHVSFDVRRGEVFGFLGPNGAGKTTTLEIIEGLTSPTFGTTRVLGLDSVAQRDEMQHRIGVQLQSSAYFEYLTLEEILDLFGSFYERSLEPETLLAQVGLLERRASLLKHLSGGQAQRFSIIAAMVNDPEVVFLDEPTTGLDPQARRNLWDLIEHINGVEGKTVVMTTHYMEEAQILCDRVAIIDHGRIQALDSPLGLIHELASAYRIHFATGDDVDVNALGALPGVHDVTPVLLGAFNYELAIAEARDTLPAFMHWANSNGVRIDDVQVVPATLEDVFLSLTGRSLRE